MNTNQFTGRTRSAAPRTQATKVPWAVASTRTGSAASLTKPKAVFSTGTHGSLPQGGEGGILHDEDRPHGCPDRKGEGKQQILAEEREAVRDQRHQHHEQDPAEKCGAGADEVGEREAARSSCAGRRQEPGDRVAQVELADSRQGDHRRDQRAVLAQVGAGDDTRGHRPVGDPERGGDDAVGHQAVGSSKQGLLELSGDPASSDRAHCDLASTRRCECGGRRGTARTPARRRSPARGRAARQAG